MRRALILAIILLAVGSFQAWFLGLNPANFAERHASGSLTDRYAEVLSKGQTYLQLGPDAQSKGESETYPILDASYYGTGVYLYFGIVPFAVLVVPWHILTGTFLSESACILIFTQVGYIFYACALCLVFRNDRRPSMGWLQAAAVLALIVGSGTWPLMARPAIYEIEGACGYACFAGAVASLAASLGAGKHTRLFLMGASLFAGLTLGCRPNYAPAVGLLAIAIGIRSWRSREAAAARTRAVLFNWAPLAIVGVLLAAWNYARFSNIFEFGYGYTEFARDKPALTHFSPGNVFYNLHRYLLGGFRFGHYFPFIEGVREGPLPLPGRTHEPVDQLYGGWILFPILAYSLLPILKRCAFACLLVLAVAGNLLLLSGLGFGTYRYPADYLGILSFTAGMGICCVPRIAGRVSRFIAWGLLVPLLAWSLAASICLAASIARTTSLFDVRRPADYSLLSAPFNAIAFWVEGVAHGGPRAIRLHLVFPRDRLGKLDPIVVTGNAGMQDFVYAYYYGPNEVQIGFESMGHGGPISAPVRIEYGVPHNMDIALGSFLPPDNHPILKQLAAGDVSLARDFVRIAIDGQTVLESAAHLHATRSRILIGESPDEAAFGTKFTGNLLDVERPLLSDVGLFPSWKAGQFGPLEVTFRLKPIPSGSRQPLICVGYRPASGILFAENVPPGRVRLGWLVDYREPIYSDPMEWNLDRVHRLEFHAGSLLPPTRSGVWPPQVPVEEREKMKRQFMCILDGKVIWRLEQETPEASPPSVIIGRNGILQSNMAELLNGEVTSVARKAW